MRTYIGLINKRLVECVCNSTNMNDENNNSKTRQLTVLK